ncbi:MAG: S8 family serine peptidase [Candidatus Woesearchaeota archaeon]
MVKSNLKIKIFVFLIFILNISIIQADMRIPGFDLEIEQNFSNTNLMSHSNEKKDVIVFLKEPIDIQSWDVKSKSLNKSKLDRLRRRIFLYTKRLIDEPKINVQDLEENWFSASLTQSEIMNLKSLNVVDKIEIDQEISPLLDDTRDLTNATNAWDFGYDGSNVGVCVVDSGVDYTHESLGGCEKLYDYSSNDFTYSATFSKNKTNNDYDEIGSISSYEGDSISFYISDLDIVDGDVLSFVNREGEVILEEYDSNSNGFWTSDMPFDDIGIRVELNNESSYERLINITQYRTKTYTEACEKVVGGWNFIDGTHEIIAGDHGTHVAGIISADSNKLKGIAPKTHIISSQIVNGDVTSTSMVYKGMKYCIENSEKYNVSVISISLGINDYFSSTECSDQSSLGFTSLINEAHNKDILITASSGNDGSENGITFPACLDGILSVGAVDKSDSLYQNTNRNELLDILSYGVNINSTLVGNSFGSKTGTSMSTPHVAAAISLYKDQLTNFNKDFTNSNFLLDLHRTEKYISENGNSYPILDIFKLLNLDLYSVKVYSNNSFYGPESYSNFNGLVEPFPWIYVKILKDNLDYWNGSEWISNEVNLSLQVSDNYWSYPLLDSNFNHSSEYEIEIYSNETGEFVKKHSFYWDEKLPEFSILFPSNNTIYGKGLWEKFQIEANDQLSGLSNAVFQLKSPNDEFWNGSEWLSSSSSFDVNFENFNTLNSSFNFENFNIVGNYSLFVSIYDNVGNFNSTEFIFNINRSKPKFDNPIYEDEMEYGDDWSGINFSVNSDFPIDQFWVNNSNLFQINNTGFLNLTKKIPSGFYPIEVFVNNSIGNTNKTFFNLSVTKKEPFLFFNLSNNNSHDIINVSEERFEIEYGNNLSISGLGCPNQLVCSLYKDGIEVNNPQKPNLSAGSYQYDFYTSGNQNYTESEFLFYLDVSKIESKVKAYVNNSYEDIEIEHNNSLFLNGTLIDGFFGGDEVFKVKLNDETLNQTNNSFDLNYNYSFDKVGFYYLNVSYSGNENYSSDYDIINITVYGTKKPYFTDNPDNQSIIYEDNWSGINFNSTSDYEIEGFFINDTDKFEINQTGYLKWKKELAAGNYSINVTTYDIFGNENYTIFNLFINKKRPNLSIEGKNQTYYGEENIIEGLGCPDQVDCELRILEHEEEISGYSYNTINLDVDDYDILFTSPKNQNYSSSFSNSIFLKVDKNNMSLDISFSNESPLKYGHNFTSNCTTINGSLETTLLLNNSEINQNENITINSSYLLPGDYNFTCIYEGDSNYNPTNFSKKFIIEKLNPNLELYGDFNTVYGSEVNFGGESCPDELDCNLFIDGNLISNPFSRVLSGGDYFITYNTSGNSIYSSTSATETLFVSKNDSSLISMNITPNGEHIEVGSTLKIESYLLEGDFGSLNLTLNNHELNSSNDSNLSFDYSFNELGTFKIRTDYFGSNNYSSKYEEKYITFIDTTPPLFIDLPNKINKTYNNETNIQINITDNYKIDSVWINDTENFQINKTGFLNWSESLSVGQYRLKIYANDSEGNLNFTSFNLNISRSQSKINLLINGSKENLTLEFGDSIWINSSLLRGELGEIILSINNETLNSSNSKKNLSHFYDFNTLGSFNISFEYISNNNYFPSNDSISVTVKDSKPPRYTDFNLKLPYLYNSGRYWFNISLFDPNGINESVLFLKEESDDNYEEYSLENSGSLWFFSLDDLPSGDYSYYFWAKDNKGDSDNLTAVSKFYIREGLSEGEVLINETEFTIEESSLLYLEDLKSLSKLFSESEDSIFIDLNNLITDNKLFLKNNLSFFYKDHSVNFFSDTLFSFTDSYDGFFRLPLERNIEFDNKEVSLSISVGGDEKISFNKPIMINLSNQAGKKLSWIHEETDGNYVSVEHQCDNFKSPENIEEGGEDICHIDKGDDKIIWTHHLSTFVTWNNKDEQEDDTNENEEPKDDMNPIDDLPISPTSSEDDKYIFDLKKDNINILDFSEENSVIERIEIDVNSNLDDVEFSLKTYENLSEDEASKINDNDYYYIEFDSDDLDIRDINNIRLFFKVSNQWMGEIDYSNFNINAFYYNDSWKKTDTFFRGNNNLFHFFGTEYDRLGLYGISVERDYEGIFSPPNPNRDNTKQDDSSSESEGDNEDSFDDLIDETRTESIFNNPIFQKILPYFPTILAVILVLLFFNIIHPSHEED